MLRKHREKNLPSLRLQHRSRTSGDIRGSSESYLRIWVAVEKIPRGKVSTYGAIARIAGRERHARLVGYALHNLPAGSEIPWHRVVNSQGKISLPGDAGRRQALLLKKEGITLSKGRVNLGTFGWPRKSSKHLQ